MARLEADYTSAFRRDVKRLAAQLPGHDDP